MADILTSNTLEPVVHTMFANVYVAILSTKCSGICFSLNSLDL